jgi:hypothetical protein
LLIKNEILILLRGIINYIGYKLYLEAVKEITTLIALLALVRKVYYKVTIIYNIVVLLEQTSLIPVRYKGSLDKRNKYSRLVDY